MGDDYLWDKSGPPDPEIARLERVLGTLKYAEKPASGAAPEARPPAEPVPIARARRFEPRRWIPLAAAAALAAGFAAVILRPLPSQLLTARRIAPLVEHPFVAPSGPTFAVTRLAGAPRLGGAAMGATGLLGVGEWLETDRTSIARVTVASIGEVEVLGEARLRLTAIGDEQLRLDLARGTIWARVLAPPRLFVVGTPSATAVDLGCAYTLSVDDTGAGALRVASGWVALEDGPRASFVPAGATCRTRPGAGPGTPSFDDAPAALRDALARFDFEQGGEAAAREALAAARAEDALTVWHLLARVDAPLRRDVYRRLATLAPPPPSVSEALVLGLDRGALAAWRRAIMKSDLPITW
jgi:hypothetical protein